MHFISKVYNKPTISYHETEAKSITSEGLEQFLTWIRETEQLYRISCKNEQEANDATQDVLHSIELEEHSYNEMAKLSKKLKEIRQQRRVAKDLMEQTLPVCEWADANRQTIKNIEQLLGTVRKAEKKTGSRIYTPRTEAAKL